MTTTSALKIASLVIIAGICLWLAALAAGYQPYQCNPQSQSGHDTCDFLAFAWFPARVIVRLTVHYERFFEVLFAFAVAAFTGTLWFSTQALWRETKRAGDLARQEFVASHRPKIIVRAIETPSTDAQLRETVKVTIVNIGESPAIVFALACDLDYLERDDSLIFSSRDFEPYILASGQRHEFSISAPSTSNLRAVMLQSILHAGGTLRYRDENGVERETGFYRYMDSDSYRFVRSADPDKEYVD